MYTPESARSQNWRHGGALVREDKVQREKEARNGGQGKEGQGKGSKTEGKETRRKGKKKAGETTEKNSLVEGRSWDPGRWPAVRHHFPPGGRSGPTRRNPQGCGTAAPPFGRGRSTSRCPCGSLPVDPLLSTTGIQLLQHFPLAGGAGVAALAPTCRCGIAHQVASRIWPSPVRDSGYGIVTVSFSVAALQS